MAGLPQRPIPRKATLARPEVAAAVAAYLGVTATQGRSVLDGVIAVLRQLLVAGHTIELRGFGTHHVIRRVGAGLDEGDHANTGDRSTRTHRILPKITRWTVSYPWVIYGRR